MLTRYLAKTIPIPIISSSLELDFDWFSKKFFSTKSVGSVPIWLRNNTICSPIIYNLRANINNLVLLIEIAKSNSLNENLSVFSEEFCDTTLSILKMLLLCIIIFDLNGDHVTIHSIHHTKNFLTFEFIFILFTLNFI